LQHRNAAVAVVHRSVLDLHQQLVRDLGHVAIISRNWAFAETTISRCFPSKRPAARSISAQRSSTVRLSTLWRRSADGGIGFVFRNTTEFTSVSETYSK